ncbi:uncharacterized protein NPIL_60951 [Nephila pilipes]|uniref:Uncharacterized protein n=1 Tax=Nephila pilipes TaxID=299642 RepID=A0A8X6UFK0_NEPPI|nr:uncharacterized protein NPIL_60951 [Nephila pilipes]
MINSFSLEFLALSKVTICIYCNPNIEDLEHETHDISGVLLLEQWELVAMEKVSCLNLPVILKEKIIAFMRQLSDEINEWKIDHSSILECPSLESPIDYVWKGTGTIDRIKTAKSFIQSKRNDLLKRFQMACVYCLEEETKQLWDEIGSPAKILRSTRIKLTRNISDPLLKRAVNEWITLLISGDVDWSRRPFPRLLPVYCLNSLIIQGNLLQILYPVEQLYVFIRMMKEGKSEQVKTFCLTQMNEKQFEEVLKREPLQVYKALSNRPFHPEFHKMVDSIYAYLSESKFINLMHKMISEKERQKPNVYYYETQLKALWNRSPDRFKQYIWNYPTD